MISLAVFAFLASAQAPAEATAVDGELAGGIPFASLADSVPLDVDLLRNMDVRRWPDDGFYEARLNLTDAMSSAHADEQGVVMLDLAELHLSQMLTAEAASFIEAARLNGWMDTDRYVALHDAVKLLSSEPVDNIDLSPLAAADRPDRALWLTLNGVANGDIPQIEENLQGALIGMSYQNGPISRALLPLIAEVAIRLENDPVSAASLSLLESLPEVSESPAGYYLRGRYQANLGNTRSALEAYFEASQGWDQYAARARIALADLALEDDSDGALLAARDVLAAGIGAWRGDVLELTTLERQAEVSNILGEPVTALLAYRRILTRFPESRNAEEAFAAASRNLEQVYRAGVEGRIDLSEWFEFHQLLLPTYRYFPEFPRFNEMLADKVFELGGTYLAITEYQQTLGIYANWDVRLAESPQQADVDRVTFKLALAHERARDWNAALETLEQIDLSQDAEMRERVNKLRVRLLGELGDDDMLLRTFVAEPDAESLRNWARALFVRKDWEGAKAQYVRLLDTHPDQLKVQDASYLLIIAHRTQDDTLGRRVASEFPQLTQSEEIATLAARFLEEPAPLLPLSGDTTFERLESAGDVITLLDGSGL